MGSTFKDLSVIVYLSRVVSVELLSDCVKRRTLAHGHNVSVTIIMIMYILTI